jgi:signal transduction histidine kinase
MKPRRAGLIVKISIPVLGTTMAASALLGTFAIRQAASHVTAEFDRAALRTAAAIEAQDEASNGDLQGLQATLERAVVHDPLLVAIDLVQDAGGRPVIVASSDPTDVGRVLSDTALGEVLPGRSRQRTTADSTQPVLQTVVRFTSAGPPTYAIVSMSLSDLRATTADIRRSLLLAVVAAIGTQLLALSVLIFRIVIGPLRRVEQTAVDVAAGRLDARVPPRKTMLHDEIDAVASQFNNTIAALDESFRRERHDAERLAQLNAQKDTILNAVSHDLRSPLTGILGAATTLQRTAIDDDARADLVEGIRRSGQKMFRLVTNLLDLSRLERGLVGPDRRDVDVCEVVSRVVAEAVEETGRDVRMVCPDGPTASVDPVQTERAVDNLVTNAVKHTSAGPIEVRAEATADGLLLSVRDHGPGVPEDLKRTIFDAFRTAGDSPGVGIGLSLVARFAEQHDGAAWVEDAPNGGAIFRVLLGPPPRTDRPDSRLRRGAPMAMS